MATTASSTSTQTLHNNNNEVSRDEIQVAITKAVELRALHAALKQGNINNSPANPRLPPSHTSSQFSAQDYPIFTPSYDVEPVPGYHHIRFEDQSLMENWEGFGLVGRDYDETSLRKGLTPSVISRDSHFCHAQDHKSVASHTMVLQASPATDISMSSTKMGSETCNRCKPATISTETDSVSVSKDKKSLSNMVPSSDSHLSVQSQQKSKGPILSRLFNRIKKKHKNGATTTSPSRAESEVSQILKDFEIMSVEKLKKELMEANKNRDAALTEAAEMKSCLGELKHKLEYLESYCEELKKALQQTKQGKVSQALPKRGTSIDENIAMPVTHEVMVEGFVQIVSEARLSVKQFCRTLVSQIEDTNTSLMEKLNLLLQPYKLSINSKHSKVALYHLEALISQSLYQDFENCIFQKNGHPKILDHQKEREAQFQSFISLRNLSWNEVVKKGTKFYSEEFSKFCDQKMSCILLTLSWTKPWPEQLLQAFFVAAKCIWLLHLLAFSFNPAVGILRVEDNRSFDPLYMDDIFVERERSQLPVSVKIMVMPGFYVHDTILRCKVLCRYKSAS
ncbi:hypothetical protein GIB67_040188 [Kingdonia uniflora]|uniref:IRK-interacting protein n=1 Tax=Kingdonia uniflora TaxID=39325 RepID=A0A7J7MV09_9MAGN|nr:hypothetical protein GIB67_040188 [Kingdonia uniflora]